LDPFHILPTMPASSLILSRRDLDFMLHEWLQVVRLAALPRYAEHSRQTFDAVLDTAERIATERFAPHNKKGDQQEAHFDGERVHVVPEVRAALDAFIDSGLMAATHDTALGGMQLPVVVDRAAMAWFFGANMSTSGFLMLTQGNASTLLAHGTPAQVEAFARPQIEGRYFGTMCLSEPQAGSSLSDIVTRAEYEGDSAFGPQYRLRGNKMWISGADHELSENIVHLVLAKVPNDNGRLIPGVKGISLFIVPRFLVNPDGTRGERNDVAVAGLNHKMGFRGLPNALLNFGEGRHRPGGRAGAVGYRVGTLHRGLACMFHMMNEARIGVGLGSAMLGYTGYLHALDYARNRPQGRPLTADGKQADTPQVPLIEHADVRRMLLSQKAYAEGALALNLYCALLVDEQRHGAQPPQRERARLLLEILTPIAKSWPSQWCLLANDLAIQVHGGYGYTRDYNVEQFYRDNRLNPIHEGTHGIQALDLLGRKVVMDGGKAFALLAQSLRDTAARASALPAHADQAAQLEAALARVERVTRTLWSAGDPQTTLANAAVYLEVFGHLVMAWIWLEQALAATAGTQAGSADFYLGKQMACRYFFEFELPRIGPQLDLLESLNPLTLEMRDAWF
jgi:alkylation response protein AidB-like acyl-CoA dehydrogenase